MTLPEVGPDAPTLRDALRVADGRLFAPARSTRFESRTFTGVEFYDPSTPTSEYVDRIVLGAGVAPTHIATLLTELADAGAAALVLRTAEDSTPDESSTTDEHPALAVLRTDRGDWAQLANLLGSLFGAHSIGQVTGVRMGDLFALANTIATLAGGAVSIVDSAGQVVGYSTHSEQPIDDARRRTTLLLQEDFAIVSDSRYRSLLRHSEARHFPSSTDLFGRVGIAVRASGELLGSIWVIQIDPSAAASTRSLLQQMEPIAAQHLLRAREDADDRDRRTSGLLRTLLEGRQHARGAASQLLIRPEDGCVIVCFRANTFDDVHATRGLHRLLHLAISVSSAAIPGSHSAIVGPEVVTLIAGPHDAAVETFTQAVIRTDGALIAGVGTRAHDVTGIARSYREAAATAGMLMSAFDHDKGHHPRIASFDGMRDRLALMQVTDLIEGLDAVVGDSASILAQHDAARGTDLTRTMRVYLDHLGSVRETAHSLHVHQNTVRYRLDVVRNELGIDLDSPDARLWLWLRLSGTPRAAV